MSRDQFVLSSLAAGLLAVGAVAETVPSEPQRPPRYTADIGLVRLSVTARDANGGLVHDLQPDEFQVFEDGVPQQIGHFGHHEAPISVVVLFDKSGSMSGEKLMHAKDAVVNLVRALGLQDEVLVIAFSESIDALGHFGLDAVTIEAATKHIRVQSMTRLHDAVLEAADAISAPARKEKGAILILSDGEDTASIAKLEDAAEAVRIAGVPVYAIGIEMDEGEGQPSLWRELSPGRSRVSPLSALRRLTDGTGGWTYPIVAAKRCKEVCVRVAEELHHQYLLGYSPTPTEDARWRSIEVRTTRPGVSLATRTGYYGERDR